MNEPQPFDFHGAQIRTVLVENEPYFVGKDVAGVLGYSQTAKAIREHVDEDDKGVSILDTPGGEQSFTIINESGLYSLILSSKLSAAKEFKRWVTHEVLPSIRKHGAYMTDAKLEEALLNPDTIITLATQLKDERTKRLTAEQRVGELQPKADYYDKILANKSLITTTAIAKNYGMSARALNKKLHELKIQFNQSGSWFLYSKYQDAGYTHTEMIEVEGSNHTHPQTKWTQKGHLFIYQTLKKDGVLPMIEQKQEA
jgi:prophage antirepressor-like protein